MPRFDGTGPMGKGPLTGGGRGNCTGGIVNRGLGQAFARGPGRGTGQGRGFGRGFGRGQCFGQGFGRAFGQGR